MTTQAARLVAFSLNALLPVARLVSVPKPYDGRFSICPAGKLAAAFHRFCQLNPKPCPIIGISEVGNPSIPSLGIDLDIRTDLPRYRVWRDGKLIEEPTNIVAHWRDDLVAFVIGCSFSFEHALMADGSLFVTPRRVATCRCTAPMCRARRLARSPATRRVDATVQSGRRDPRNPDHYSFSRTARRTGALWRSRSDRHQRHHEAELRGRGDHSARRSPGILGVRRDTAIDHSAIAT
jgi:hypothetical protein